MSRFIACAWLGLIVTAIAPAPSLGQTAASKDPIIINNRRIGFFPANSLLRGGDTFKDGFWAPVYVDLTCQHAYSGQMVLVVETNDCDESPTQYSQPIPQMQPGMSETIIGYARPGGRGEINISVQLNGRDVTSPQTIVTSGRFDPAHLFYLSIGSKLEAARLPGVAMPADDDSISTVNGRSILLATNAVNQLPQLWFGYDGIDLAVLVTSDRDFMTKLIEERDNRKSALTEWVRRGGRLVVSVGRNADLVAGSDELKELLPLTPIGTAEVNLPRLAWRDGGSSEEPLGQTTVARLSAKPNRTANTLVSGPANEGSLPLVTRSAFGLGEVTLVALDVDSKAMASWKSRGQFWEELMNRAGPRVPKDPPNSDMRYRGMVGYDSNTPEDSLRDQLKRELEDFPGVPVISFGWVALFILLYIIVVGPLDYLFLKKVVKRLELTWITFPAIVLIVSAGAYYAAYALKGSDLRINKYDLVDIDLNSRTALGRTWFTLFSPRIQNYRVSLEPGAPDWAPEDQSDVIVGWSGASRQGRGSLFRRSYAYTPRATGLDGVPVQVWSTKAFEGQWLASLPPTSRLVQADLRHPPGRTGVIGSVTVNFPLPLDNAFLLVPGTEPTVLPLGTLTPGTPKQVAAAEAKQFTAWVNNPIMLGLNPDRPEEPVAAVPGWLPAALLFNDRASSLPKNVSLRGLDASWRLGVDNVNEVILVGTLRRREGSSEEVTADAASPSRLWLGDLPQPGHTRPALEGKMRQDTCIRVFIPVRSSDTP
ncbi:MAG: hypothetical protein ACJ8C4_08730 [Gemmataceae bacterium]